MTEQPDSVNSTLNARGLRRKRAIEDIGKPDSRLEAADDGNPLLRFY
jgi:hypothetical protein